mmetsp:Transcript_8191/g.19004  ORF Transcript_8191/g.19004 Transcript_8191/m.19004 type:complete len:199 (+) Transcript_8191:127-723(+)|eukprot:CAMPEP_0116848062 /NCGR_PEP_ID=MMETSP0418-20121206/14784_1 /TAXON_ID=1158023 /ORGANISM="Astrosyne radiata, Strain 13vi08-1A" /LENGTH=198 /DNA_ID=CAMNT_0004479583 /DNA_START=61 /DNA_END=660 /DNA_ORIENTATION=+
MNQSISGNVVLQEGDDWSSKIGNLGEPSPERMMGTNQSLSRRSCGGDSLPSFQKSANAIMTGNRAFSGSRVESRWNHFGEDLSDQQNFALGQEDAQSSPEALALLRLEQSLRSCQFLPEEKGNTILAALEHYTQTKKLDYVTEQLCQFQQHTRASSYLSDQMSDDDSLKYYRRQRLSKRKIKNHCEKKIPSCIHFSST